MCPRASRKLGPGTGWRWGFSNAFLAGLLGGLKGMKNALTCFNYMETIVEVYDSSIFFLYLLSSNSDEYTLHLSRFVVSIDIFFLVGGFCTEVYPLVKEIP